MNNDLLQQVYQQYSREIYVYLFTLCKNHDMAEDLRQETFLKAILSLPDDHTNVRAWLYRVARNLCFNQLKRDKHTDESHSADERAPCTDEPEEAVWQSIKNQVLYRAILQLSDVKREVILLHYFSEMPYDEMAKLLGVPAQNLRATAVRAKRELKKIMEEQGYDVS